MEIVYNSGRLKAWVYIANENRISEGLPPERDYLAHLLAGKDYLSKAYIVLSATNFLKPPRSSLKIRVALPILFIGS